MKDSVLNLGGFEAITRSISNNTGDYDIVNPSVITGEGTDDVEDDDKELDDIEDISTEVDVDNSEDDKKDTKVKNDEVTDLEDLGEMESEVAEYVQEKLFKEFGFEIDDKKFESIADIVEFVKEVVEENSKLEYADEEVMKIDEFVKNGGDVKTYFDTVYAGVDPNEVDLDNTSEQKSIIRENFKNKGYTEARISKMIERYEDAGTLRDEAEDALELVKEYKETISQKLLEDQKNQKQTYVKEQQRYIESVEKTILDVKDIRGIPITDAERKKLMDYIFKPTSEGKTQYQIDYIKDKRNLIESAYFTMKGDAFVKKVQTQANSEAARKLKQKLENKGKRGKNQEGQSDNFSSSWLEASSFLRNPYNKNV